MKKISQRLLAATVVAAACASASAEVLSPEEALGRALPQARNAAPALTKPVLAYTAEADEQPAVYVFAKENKGFLVVSADDAVAPLLGYTDKGSFDADNMAPGLKYWLGEYARQISYARENGMTQAPARLARPERAAIAPLVKTKWDQGLPYCLYAPTAETSQGEVYTPTGCVATAAAQVMKYHEYPEKGTGKFSFPGGNVNPQVEEIVLEDTPFKWADMLDSYTKANPGTAEQQAAVAELMLTIGYGVGMNYTAEASGAQTINVSKILAENFDYDKSVTYVQRNCYTLSQWEEIIYSELAQKRVVLYDGSTVNNEGHAFVCDGYDKDGLFHINWGWGGMSDGYFLLGTLDPSTQGAGGAASGEGFDYHQDATINIMPNQGGSAVASITASGKGLLITGNSTGNFNLGREVTVSYDGGGFYNHNWNTIAPKFGLHIVGEGQDFWRWSNAATSEIASNYGKTSYGVLLSGVKTNAKYVLTPAFKVEGGEPQEIGMPYGQTRSYLLTTKSSTGELSPISNDVTVTNVALSGTQIPEVIGTRDRITLSADFVNETDQYYYGHLAPAFFEKKYGEYELFSIYNNINFTVNLEPGESETWKVENIRFSSASGFEPEKYYYFGFLSIGNDGSLAIVSDLQRFCYGKAPAGINDVTADANTIAVITPNPADSYFTVQGIEVSAVNVYSLAGNLVAAADEATVDVTNLAAGLYIVEVTDVDGNRSTARLIKK